MVCRCFLAISLVLSGCGFQSRPQALRAFRVDTLATAASVAFERPTNGVVLPDGRVAVLDYQADRIFVLRPDGSLDTTLGRSGAGPGELRASNQLVLRGDTLAVLNAGNVRVENFLLPAGLAPGRPLPSIVQSRDARLLPGDSILVATGGTDSALAVLQDTAGNTITRYGRPVVPATSEWNFEGMREEILKGGMPAQFRNMATPIAGTGGDVWLIHHTEGRLLRFAHDGGLRATIPLPDDELVPLKRAFIEANTAEKRAGVLRPYYLAFQGIATGNHAWLLLALPDSVPPVLLRLGADSASIERYPLPGAEGARYLIATPSEDLFYAVHPTEGIVFRVHRDP